jgi:hypothetical protein
MAHREFDITVDGPTLISPNGGEQVVGSTISITWNEPENIPTTEITWYELFIVESYDVKSFPNLVQIATLPSGTSSFTYTINKNLKGKKCRIGIRASNHKGQRSEISFSADDIIITNRKIPIPSIFSPSPSRTYFSYIPIAFDQKGILGRCSQRTFYQVYYKTDSQNIDWTLAFSDILVGSEPINWDVSDFPTASDYSIKVELVDEDNVSEPLFLDNITINNINYFLIDTVPPKGNIKIQNVEEYTMNRDLIVSLEASDATTATKEYRIEQTNIIPDGENTTDVGVYNNMTGMATWNISGDDGEKLIKVRYRDYADNVLRDSGETHFRTFKSVDNKDVSAILVSGSDVWMAFSDEDDSSYVPKLYRNNTLISTLTGIPTDLEFFNGNLYISIKDDENKGILQRYAGGEVSTVADNEAQYLDDNDSVFNSLYYSDSVINSMETFDDTLFLGLENGQILSFRGSTVSLENNDNFNIKSVSKMETDGNVLYIYFNNTTEIMIMSKISSGAYNFSTVDLED